MAVKYFRAGANYFVIKWERRKEDSNSISFLQREKEKGNFSSSLGWSKLVPVLLSPKRRDNFSHRGGSISFVASASFLLTMPVFFSTEEKRQFFILFEESVSVFSCQCQFFANTSFYLSTEEKRQFFILFEESVSVLLPVPVFWRLPVLVQVTALLSLKRRDNFSFSLKESVYQFWR